MGYLRWLLLERKTKRLNWELLRRKRKRSWSCYPSPDISETEPRSIRFIYQTKKSDSEFDIVRIHMLTIPLKELIFFEQTKDNLRIRHIHHPSHCDPVRFRDITTTIPPVDLGVLSLCPLSSQWLIGSDLYALYGELTQPELWSHSLDPTVPPRRLSSPLESPRCWITSFALGDKLYIWRNMYFDTPLYFAEVYDPDTDVWSGIKAPPSLDPGIGQHVFVESLGEDEGKFMVFDYERGFNSRIHLYDISTGDWIIHDKVRPYEFDPARVYHSTVINKDDGHLYWLDARRGYLCALDWRSMRLYKGPIVGAEHMAVLRCLKYLHSGVFLQHLWGQYFCLVSSHELDLQIHDPSITENHFTFLRVVRDCKSGLLTGFVVGCFVDSRPLSPTIADIICV